jgi:HSP20 family protein
MCKVNSSFYLHGLDRRIGGQAHWVPNTDVFVVENTLVIKVELAGIQREHLELIADGNRLHICGERPDTCRAAGCKFLVMEVNYGPFECVLEIPKEYGLSRAKAAYQNGFLRVDVPQSTRKSSKRVKVRISEAK